MTSSRQTDEATCLALAAAASAAGSSIVFVSGNFNVLHAGHLRLLRFAADCGDVLIVGINPDGAPGTHMEESLRQEGVAAIACVTYAVLLRGSAEDFIKKLRPAIVVKGKEHETGPNPEELAVASYGGRILFSSGEFALSSFDLMRREFGESGYPSVTKPSDYPRRHGFASADLSDLVQRFRGLRVLVLGDLIVDEYVACEPLGMSQEDPTIVVAPIQRERFVGGAGIVAGHAAGFGATVTLVSVTGRDEIARFAIDKLRNYAVETRFFEDHSRPTTLKQRYRAAGKTLLRVNTSKHHGVDAELQEAMLSCIRNKLAETDLIVFSDFSYGCLPQRLVDAVAVEATRRGIPMAADSQSSSQIGDIGRFKGMILVKPTEREARLALRDFDSGLVVVGQKLAEQTAAENVVITLGSEGLIVHTNSADPASLVTDRLPAFNRAPLDVAGAGDSLLVSTAMALAAGGDIWRSVYLGSIVAAGQVGRVGNLPLRAADVLREIGA